MFLIILTSTLGGNFVGISLIEVGATIDGEINTIKIVKKFLILKVFEEIALNRLGL
tara:strand:+ start:2167 stop:2334 length:168 start_codon:yes stop_codon:yes gene_type:complete